ncbi:MAG: hypothetical protein ABEK10_04105 [Candidatus Nanosalina sp.]
MGDRLFSEDSDLEGSVREYMLYFTGMGEGESRNVELNALLEELPYSSSEIINDLESLEDHGYVQSSHSEIYPLGTDGFESRLEETVFSSVDESFYRLDDRGLEFLRETGLRDYEESLRRIFQ